MRLYKYIQEIYLPRHNEQFSIKPAREKNAFIPWNSIITLDDVLCLEEERIVQHDNTVRYKGLTLQIPKSEYRHHHIKAGVKVHEYFDHSIGIFYGTLCIGKYYAEGCLQEWANKKQRKVRVKQISEKYLREEVYVI